MWVRGLKQDFDDLLTSNGMSHPMWVRGLKLLKAADVDALNDVAPHVGAWIETLSTDGYNSLGYVAPHVGAWIETRDAALIAWVCAGSHPMWVRGLKLRGRERKANH